MRTKPKVQHGEVTYKHERHTQVMQYPDTVERRVQPGGLYRHFKGLLYEVIGVGKHTETGEDMVFYQALYGEHLCYVRPKGMFLSEVDHEKYPDVACKYRFELIN